jgi:hypothetical protein
MNRKTIRLAAVLGLAVSASAGAARASGPRAEAVAASSCGLGVNLSVVGRLIGAADTLYTSTVDVSNNAATDTQVDFYLDGKNQATSESIHVAGSVSTAGDLVAVGTGGAMRGRSNAHFDDFIDSLVQSGMLPASIEADGILGSVMFVFNGFDKSGEGSAFVRFFSAYGGGTIGQALRGHEISANEPRAVMAAFRDSRAQSSGPRLYANMFINNTGLTSSGQLSAGDTTVHCQAYANSTGQPVGTPFDLVISPGQTVSISDVLRKVAAPPGEDTVLVYATATSGSATIAGVAVEIDDTTKDGSVVEMNRADF